MTLFGSGYGASGGSGEVRPRSGLDPQSWQVNQVTPVSPKLVVEVWLERLEPTLGSDLGLDLDRRRRSRRRGARLADRSRRRRIGWLY